MKKKQISIVFTLIIAFFMLVLTGCGKTTIEQLTNDYGIVVDGGSFEKDSILISNEINSTTTEGARVLEYISEIDYDLVAGVYIFDIYVESAGIKVQPNGKVTVTIPLPNKEIKSGIILHIKDNMEIEKIIPIISDGNIKFETNSFSYFVLVQELKECQHVFSEWETLVEATCEQDGSKVRYCSICKIDEVESVPALKHDIISHEGQDATCTEPGYKAYETCSRCNYTTYEELPALKHDIISHEGQDATCTEPGYKAYETCSRCNYTTYEEIPSLGHKYSKVDIIKEPTCEEEGLEKAICENCSASVENILDKKGHIYGIWTVISESTCVVHGKQEHTCLVCEYKEEEEAPLADHSFGDWSVYKEPTLQEEGIERRTCSICGAYEEYPIDKLNGYTVVVSGGTVNRKGENKNQSSIYVAEGEIVEIVAYNYDGYTFYQWFSDSTEIIPTSTFELYVTRDSYFYICFEEGLDYGDWVLEQEKTCTQNGVYSRTDSKTGLKQYMVSFSRGYHDLVCVEQDKSELKCTDKIFEYYECFNCDYTETHDVGELGHDFSGTYVIVEEAYGSKVGLKQIKCTRCDATKTKEYIKAAYPDGNIKVTFDWDHRSYTSTTDRNEIHWMLDGNKYCFYVNRDSDSDTHFYFYYEDLGKHSPVYVKKIIGNSYSGRNGYGSYGWGIVGYVDSYDEFIEYIDSKAKGSDNGRNNSGLHTVYTMWEDIFNEYGGIPSSYYCSAVVDYYGYTCRIYENDGFAYYVTEDNCCLYFSGKGYNRDFAYVSSIEEITEIPYGPVDYEQIYYIMIDIKDAYDPDFNDSFYFDVENLYSTIELYEANTVTDREVILGFEVKDHSGNWVVINGMSELYGTWVYNNGEGTYIDLVNNYLERTYPDSLEIRAIIGEANLPVHVTVKNGCISDTYNDYGTDNKFPANYEITLWPQYDSSIYTIDYWKITINGVTEEIRETYLYAYELTLPESGEVIAECVLKDFTNAENKVDVTVNVIGNGSLNISTGKYSLLEPFTAIANASKGNIFVGWFVQGMFYMSEGDMGMPSGSFNEEYYQYGEYFGNQPIFEFDFNNSYDTIVITAIFEEINLENDYIEIIIHDGFVCTYYQTALHVSALRISLPEYFDIHGTFLETQNISGWIVTEQLEDGPADTQLDGEYTGHYFTVDSEINPINVRE